MAGENFGAPDPGAHYPGMPTGSYYPAGDDMPEPQQADHNLEYSDINAHYVAITREEPISIWKAGSAWVRIGEALSGGAEAIRQQGITLSGKWEGAAQVAFLQKVGMLTAVLDNWATKANDNGVALRDTLYPTISEKRRAMVRLWQEYKQESDSIREAENANDSLGEFGADIVEAFGGKDRLAANLETYSRRSREEILNPMSTAFDSAFYKLGSGAVYQGPKDAVIKEFTPPSQGAPGAPAAPAAPAAPRAPAIAAPPGMAPSAPAVPTAALIGVMGAPQSPNMEQLRNQIIAGFRQPPTNPLNEQAMQDVQQHLLDHLPPEAPGAMPHPAFLPPPTAPGLLRPRGAAPTAPGNYTAGRGQGAAPTAPRGAGAGAGDRDEAPAIAGGLGGRGAPPQRPGMAGPGAGAGARPPAAPGLGGRGSARPAPPPSRSGLGAGSPTLGGRSGKPDAPNLTRRPGSPGIPGSGVGSRPGAPGKATPAVPRSLQGRPGASGVGARPGAPGIGGRPGAPGKPGVPGRPGTGGRSIAPRLELGTTPKGTPSLGGRSTSSPVSRQPNVDAARGALRKSLTGRPGPIAGMPGQSAAKANGVKSTRTTERLRAKLAADKAAAARSEDPRHRGDDEEAAAELALVGGTELFEADGAGDGVVAARTPQERVTRSGPAIGSKRG